MHLISIGLSLLSGAQVSEDFQLPAWPQVVAFFLLSFFFIALGEEPGFRGFALPRFMSDRSALTASLILGFLHAIWHLPLIVGGDESPLVLVNVIGAAVLFTWIFNRTNGSVFLAMLLHASSDVSAGLFGPVFSGSNAVMARIWLAIAFVAVAILLRILTGSELGRKPEAVTPVIPAEQPVAAK